MPFETFRRHQRKWLAALALLAMVAFTLDLSLFRGGGGAGRREDAVIFDYDGKPVHRSTLNELLVQRVRANQFMSALFASFLGQGIPNFFGGTTDADLRDAYVLQREAEKLGIPASPEIANDWLNHRFSSLLTPERFNQIYRELFYEGELKCTDSQLLADIASQIRLNTVAALPDSPEEARSDAYLITPYDLYRAYRERNEKVSALAVPFPVDSYVDQVGEPSEAQAREYYDKYKDQLPDPNRDTPGFKIPRRVQVEYVLADPEAIERRIRASLTDEDLRAYYREHEKEFPPELPRNLFAGDPEATLTPPGPDPFLDVRERVLDELADERARDEVERLFGAVRDEVMADFLAKYDEAVEANRDASEQQGAPKPLPTPFGPDGTSLVQNEAAKHGLEYRITPLLTVGEAGAQTPIGGSRFRGARLGAGTSFADYVFQPRVAVYEPFELSDIEGLRFLAWKIADKEPEVPPFDAVRDAVVQAWKREQARALAERDAEALADKVRAAVTPDTPADDKARQVAEALKADAGTRPVLTTSALSKLAMSLDPGDPRAFGSTRPTDIPEIPNAGAALREDLFRLEPGEVVVAADAPRATYYVLALNRRTPAELGNLFGPIGVRSMIEQELVQEATQKRQAAWMEYLRERARVGPLREGARGRNRGGTEDAGDVPAT
jgi:hypothetical protein